MNMIHLAGYKFVALNDLPALSRYFRGRLASASIKGTVLLSEEGINFGLCGEDWAMQAFKEWMESEARFAGLIIHEAIVQHQAFKRLKIKLKKEIITFRQEVANPLKTRARALSPMQLKKWLDEKRDIALVDTRNEYEIEHGTFKTAVNLNLAHFTDFPKAAECLDPSQTTVLFCTGGIRCEKAALFLAEKGFENVYQLDRGILGYFNDSGSAHYGGKCFVFDERVAVAPAPDLG